MVSRFGELFSSSMMCTLGYATSVPSPGHWLCTIQKMTSLGRAAVENKGIRKGRRGSQGRDVEPHRPQAWPVTGCGWRRSLCPLLSSPLTCTLSSSTSRCISCNKKLSYASQCLSNLLDQFMFPALLNPLYLFSLFVISQTDAKLNCFIL